MFELKGVQQEIHGLPTHHYFGQVNAVIGMMVEVVGLDRQLKVGSQCLIENSMGNILAEVVGFQHGAALLLPYEAIQGIGPGDRVQLLRENPIIHPHTSWLGRVLDAQATPIDNKGGLTHGSTPYKLKAEPISAHSRRRVGAKLDLGVRSLNTFATACRGQRLGIFAGSGIGKSVLLSMITRYTQADVIIIGLIGERGREVQEFLEDNLDEESLKRSIVVVATSDESAMRRKAAANLTMTLAEYFRDEGKEVLCLMDSVTRYAMAQREIGLSAGEPPASKGYTPTVFVELPKLLERAGPGAEGQGNITGIFTVLVEGDDHNEPISDAVRGILDGHIVLDRKLAERGHFPAVNVLKSISRMMPRCNTEDETMLIQRARKQLSTYEDMSEMIRLGAYRQGSNAEVDQAISYFPKLEAFLKQRIDERATFEEGFQQLRQIFGG